ncbi:hypothetical protein ACVWYG_001974 [Pedobacter sp. UYEF25]
MERKALNRLIKLKEEAESLPKELVTEKNFDSIIDSNSEEDKQHTYNEISNIREQKNKLIRKLIGFFNAHLEDDSIYYNHLNKLTFFPKEGIFNTIHYKNNEAWVQDRKGLINLIEILENELTEKMNLPKDKKDIFSSGLFWTILTIAVTFAYSAGIYKAEFDKSNSEKELEQTQLDLNILKLKQETPKKENDSLKGINLLRKSDRKISKLTE